MQNQIGSYDAKTKLPEILRRVQAGESFTITNRGKAIANLTPSANQQRQMAVSAVEGILKLNVKKISDQDFTHLKNQGRK